MMKFFHISDLHIGKRVNGFSMLEDQKYILNQIIELAKEQEPDGIFIAGDLYDKSTPSAEAVEMVDWFLSQAAQLGIKVWAISGNHDSAERVAYGSRMLEQAGIHMAKVFDGTLQSYTYTKEGDEKAYIWLLPYIRPAQVRRFFPDKTIDTTQQAVKAVLETAKLQHDGTNILIMHQFIAGAAVCDSEEMSIGGLDQVDVSVLEGFDYVALGHLHRPQKVMGENVRYCGSPLKYSFSEAGQEKSVTVIETGPEPGKIKIDTLPLVPRLDLREMKGPMEKILQKEVSASANPEDYLHITLTDQEEILDAIGKVREVYPNIMKLDFESFGQKSQEEEMEIQIDKKTPGELFAEFFFRQNGRDMNQKQEKTVEKLMNEIFGRDV